MSPFCSAHEFAESSQRRRSGARERRAQARAFALKAQAICLFVGRDSSPALPYATVLTHARVRPVKKRMRGVLHAAMFRRARGEGMTSIDLKTAVLEEWFRLPESRRRYATDAVAFAYRLLRDQPDLFTGPKDVGHESIVNWLLPHLAEAKTG
jgi:hypothetical protein